MKKTIPIVLASDNNYAIHLGVKMSGHLLDGTVAKSHQASDVRSFMDAEDKFVVTSAVDGSVICLSQWKGIAWHWILKLKKDYLRFLIPLMRLF